MEKQIVIEDTVGVLKACEGSTPLGRAYLGAEEIGGMHFTKTAVAILRAALCQPDPAAEARATLERARMDGICRWDLASPSHANPNFTIRLLHEHELFWAEQLPTEAEALAAAAAHVEGLRKVVVEPERMTADECIAELKLTWDYRPVDGKPTWHEGKISGLGPIGRKSVEMDDRGEDWTNFHRRVVCIVREAQQASN